tara:strand:- start:239 stop:658 length:420 start_codon:yes stop_codon:yes gene_type:complete
MKTYILKPKYKKSTSSNEYWTNTINNKSVTVVVTVLWRWSEFSINLTDEDKVRVEESDYLLLSDYDYDFIETDDGCDRYIDIQNEDNYTAIELKMIYESMYEDIDEEYFDETYMEENGWDLSDTTYEITGGVELTEENI